MPELTQFHILAHTFISLIGAVLLLAIWYNIRKRFRQILEENDSQKRVDKGLLYLSLAMLVWVAAGIWQYFAYPMQGKIFYPIIISLLSIGNNLFLLLALFYFYYAPTFIYNNEKNVYKIIGIIVITAVLTVVLPLLLQENNVLQQIRISSIPDLILSGFLSTLLLISLYRTFTNRDLKIVAFISVGVIVLMFLSQLPEVFIQFEDDFSTNLIKIIAKTSLIAIFLVLATSWVIRLANMPKPNEMSIKFMDWSLIKISIPSKGVFEQTIDFGSKTTQYRNLFKFAIRRKFSRQIEQAITVGAGGEIKNQTYLSRIIDNINSILNLEAEQQLERRDLLTFIGQGQYRLRMIPDNIFIEETLLKEFLNSAEKKEYQGVKKFVEKQ